MTSTARARSTIRFILFLPYYGIQWFRVLGLRDQERWEEIARILKRLHKRVTATDSSRYWLGTALLHQHLWEEALDEFENIQVPLTDPHEERSRLLNHALALFQVGRRQEASSMLDSSIDEHWTGEQLAKARTLVAQQQQTE